MASSLGSRFKEVFRKYGKVALGVHFSVSAASLTGLYVAINNNVDVEAMLEKVGMRGVSSKESDPQQQVPVSDAMAETVAVEAKKTRNRTAELASSSGGAFALALLCNKALFPIRVPITLALTPPISRFLARRRIIKSSL